MMSGRFVTACAVSTLAMMPRRRQSGRRAGQFVLQARDVVGALHEREADQVGVPGDEVEIGQIVCGQRIQMQVGAREGQAAFRLHLEALALRPRDTHQDTARPACLDHAGELAVIERHLGADRQAVQHIGRLAHGLDHRIAAERRRIGDQAEPIAGQQTLARLPLDLADAELGAGDIHQHAGCGDRPRRRPCACSRSSPPRYRRRRARS